MATASGRTSGHSDVSVAGEQSPVRRRQRREPGKPTWRYLNRLSSSSASLAPLNRGSLNSAHIHGTDVPVEEPSTASTTDIQLVADGDFGDLGILRVSWPFSGIAAIKAISTAALGLVLIKFSSVAAAISIRMPPRLSAICIAS